MRGGGLLSSTEGLSFAREAQRAILVQLEVTESPFVHATQDTSAPHSRRADLGPPPGEGKPQDSNLRTLVGVVVVGTEHKFLEV